MAHLAVLGTGTVGRTLGSAFLAAGHEVSLGSRRADHTEGRAWAEAGGGRAHLATFAAATAAGETVLLCVGGMVALDVLASCAPEALAGKVLIDVTNPLDFSGGFPPRLSVCNDDSVGEQIQRAHPDVRVVKALNTMAAEVMVDPAAIEGDHLVLIAGEDSRAKAAVAELLADLGWRAAQIRDLGGIDAARGMEMWLPLWLRLWQTGGARRFNLALPTAD